MDNINVLENGQQTSVSLIAYFNSNNNNYLFYTKNETVQDGLIKMYVAKEKNGANDIITDDEWVNLKKNMQNIIIGNSDVTFIKYTNTIELNPAKAIALKNENITSITNAYKNNVSVENVGGTNKDLLSESFGMPQIESLDTVNQNVVENNTQTENTSEAPVISDIPQVQNNFNMESTPVNLNMESNEPVELNNNIGIDQNNQVEAPIIEPEIPIINNNQESNGNEVLAINSIKPAENIEDNKFKVSNEPNIFDQINNDDNDNKQLNSDDSNTLYDNSKLVELNERKIKLFEELAQVYREENNLLIDKESSLEKTASDLFNNNGTLNDNKVLDQV